jgi:uncharacterized membrane protein YfcA
LHLNLYIVIGSAIVGLLVGMTGAGGGALMTPMLVLLFGVTPASAISSDLVASVVMRPVGAAVHMRAGTIHKRLVLLLFLYPRISAKQLVGTDLTQAVPLTLAAALGSLLFGHVEFGLTVSLLVGSVPAVFVGALLSSHVSDRYIRPAITFVICASGLKYVGLGVRPLAATMICLALLATIVHLIGSRRRARAAERQESGLQTPAPLG